MSRKRRAAPTTSDLDLDVGASRPLASSISDEESSGSGSDHSFDISSALTQRRVRGTSQKGKAPIVSHNDGTDDETEFEEMIRNSISRRNVKDGTELLKNTKGKKKIAKGEVGGGSFQSMGITFVAIDST
jgi:ATP-dependent RNA helicase DDX54/DBP10